MNRLVSAALVVLSLHASRPAVSQTASSTDLRSLSRSLQAVVLKVAPAVVQIRVAAYGPGTSGPLPGDVIYGVNGQQVRSLADLRQAIEKVATDSTVVLHVGREGQLRFLTMTLE